MGLVKKLQQQFEHPTGNTGKLVGWLMHKSNKKLDDWMIENAQIQPSHHVLEIGYGTGRTLYTLAQRATTGTIHGIDHSQLMFQMSSDRCREYIQQNRVRISKGTMWEVSFPRHSFHLVYGINVHFFFQQPIHEFARIRQCLKPGGRMVLVFQPRWVKSETELFNLAKLTRQQVERAGFSPVIVELRQMKPVGAIYVEGISS